MPFVKVISKGEQKAEKDIWIFGNVQNIHTTTIREDGNPICDFDAVFFPKDKERLRKQFADNITKEKSEADPYEIAECGIAKGPAGASKYVNKKEYRPLLVLRMTLISGEDSVIGFCLPEYRMSNPYDYCSVFLCSDSGATMDRIL